MIRLENIDKSYKHNRGNSKVSILNSINCNIEKGEMVAIMGRSGSGKTTLINILSGLLVSDKGKYYFDTKDIARLSTKARDDFREKNIGIIVQDHALLNSLTAKENILLPVKYRKHDQEEMNKNIIKISSKLGIEHCLDKNIYELSGGESQRVAIARALIKKPSLILADEPTGSLDINSEKEVLKLLQELKEEGNTIIIATHSNEVANCCDRVLKVSEGKLHSLNRLSD